MRTQTPKLLAALLSIAMNWLGILAVGETVASFNDTERSGGNLFLAGALDFALLPGEFGAGIGAGETVAHTLIVNHATTTIRSRYAIAAEEATTAPGASHALCLALALNAWQESTSTAPIFSGPLLNFAFATTSSTTVPTEILPLEITATTTIGYGNGDTCTVRFILDAFQEDALPGFGFYDRSIATTTFTARPQIVLNEFLPNPDGPDSQGGADGEWVEIYNNGSSPKPLDGWYIRDNRNNAAGKKNIIAANTNLGTTTVPAHGFLVVYMNASFFANASNESVRLFNNTNALIDSFSFCGQSAGNPEGCTGKTAGTSWARVPDGVGEWVDPIPTPGKPNTDERPPPTVFPDAPEGVSDAPVNDPKEDVLPVATTSRATTTSPERESEIAIAGTTTTENIEDIEDIEAEAGTLVEKIADVLESTPMEYPLPPEEETPPEQDASTTTPVAEQMESPSARVEEDDDAEEAG